MRGLLNLNEKMLTNYLLKRAELHRNVCEIEEEMRNFDYDAHLQLWDTAEMDLFRRLYVAQHRLKYFEEGANLLIQERENVE